MTIIDWPSLYLGMALALPLYLIIEMTVVPPLARLLRVRRDRGD